MSYKEEDIKVLEEIDHIRLNPGMYIGDTSNPVHLIEEALDNSLDECLAGHAKIIAVNIDTKENIFTVIDDGRGIPIGNDTPKTISSKLFSGGKFQGSKTAYKIACLKGDTKILLLNGKNITIEEMSENPNEEYWGMSSTLDGKFKPSRLLQCQQTGLTKEFYKIILDNDEFFECTEDHKLLMRDGKYKEAKDLKVNDSLMPAYFKEQDGYIFVRPNNTRSYLRNLHFENRNYVPLHQLVYEGIYGERKKEYQIHHKDQNRKNNYPTNLSLLSEREHLSVHLKLAKESGLITTEALIKYNKSEKGRQKSREVGLTVGANNFREYCKTEKHKKNKSDYMKKYNESVSQKYLQKQKVLKYCKTLLNNNLSINEENWNKFKPYGVVKFSNISNYFLSLQSLIKESNLYNKEIYSLRNNLENGFLLPIKRIVSVLKKMEEKEEPLNPENYNLYRNKFDPTINIIKSYFGNFENLIEYYRTNNHKVQRIEKIVYEKEIPVYDLYVPEYSNFVLSCGVVVHNSGLHGVGLVAINALSDFYTIEIYRDNKHAKFEFIDSKFKKQKIVDFTDKKPFSTKIHFKPKANIFETLAPDIQRIRKRMLIASLELQNCTFVLNIDDATEIIKVNPSEFFEKYCLNDSDKEISKTISISSKKGDEVFNVRFSYSLDGTTTPRVFSSVNLLPVDSGGTHISVFIDILKDYFTEKGKKLGFKFQPQDTLSGLRAYLSLELVEPKFAGQSKDKLINTKNDLKDLSDHIQKSIEDHFSRNEQQLELLLTQFQDYRNSQDSKKIKVNTGKRLSTKFTKLRDCKSKEGSLYIVEGDSAAGSYLACRDTNIHAVFPLKGKIPSIVNKKDILDNVEINELISALGTGVGPQFDISKLKYKEIICSPDADEDGGHIFCLLTIALANLVPEIIKNGYYYLARTPLYAINKGKKFIPLWTSEEVEEAKKKGETITRFKGLGELNPWQLKICALDEKTRKLIKVDFTQDINKLMKLFSDVNEKRKLLV